MSSVNQELLKSEIDRLDKNENTIYFYVVDSMGNPHPSLCMIYQQAMALYKNGFKISILHDEDEYVGVSNWMGEEFMELPHINIKSDLTIHVSDIIVIPELLSNVMQQISKVNCKKVVLCDRYDRIFELLPITKTWVDFGISDIIVTNETIKKDINKLFPVYQDIKTINPKFNDVTPNELKDLTVCLFSDNKSKVMRFNKEFIIKHPLYRWISFIDVRGVSNEKVNETLNKSAFSVVFSDGYDELASNAIRSIKSKCITLVQTQGNCDNNLPSWYQDTESCIPFDTFDNGIHILKNAIEAYCMNNIPSEIYSNMNKINEMYCEDKFNTNVIDVFNFFKNKRKEELSKFLNN